jgi:dCTP deaminase
LELSDVSALSAEKLRSLMTEKDPEKRLVVSPILDPDTQLKDSQAAVDVRLGRIFSVVRPWTHGVAELVEPDEKASPAAPLSRVVLEFGQPLIIHPHQLVLARTLEVVRLPPNLLAYVMGRSSWGRRGLIVATAAVVHPVFAGPITLELKNVGEVPIAVYPLDRIAQLTFHDVVGDVRVEKEPSQFASAVVPELGVVRDHETERRIRRMAQQGKKNSKLPPGTPKE